MKRFFSVLIFGFFAGSFAISGFAQNIGYGCNQYGQTNPNYGNNCPTVIIATNIAQSTNCIASLQLALTNNASCVFPLQGDPNNNYALPTNGILSQINSVTTQSPPCAIINNGTSTAQLQCLAIPSAGGTIGTQNINLFLDGVATPIQRGEIELVPNITPLVLADFASITITCLDATINTTTTCTFPLPPLRLFPALPDIFTLSIGNNPQSAPCVINILDQIITCPLVSVGSNPGNFGVSVFFNNANPTATSQQARVFNQPVANPTNPDGNIQPPITNPVLNTISTSLPNVLFQSIRTGGSSSNRIFIIVGLSALIGIIIFGLVKSKRKNKLTIRS
jgi:LPXTG-motif cell wall-anchored protein